MQCSNSDSMFLERLGRRIRTIREAQTISRQKLAELSGISDRFIAQLECGKGNISIARLRRISIALGLSLQDLIPAAGAGDGLLTCPGYASSSV
jgi:XRE family aerobic/anaerobic benzoate catabolism transcriptional regulator